MLHKSSSSNLFPNSQNQTPFIKIKNIKPVDSRYLKNKTNSQRSPFSASTKFTTSKHIMSKSLYSNKDKNNKNDSINTNTTYGKIYLKLDNFQEIEKIIKEEEKKIYINKGLRLNLHIDREDMKNKMKQISKSQNDIKTSIKKEIKRERNSEKGSRSPTKRNLMTKFEQKSFKNIIAVNNKLIHNYKYQGEREILKSKINFEAVNKFLENMEKEKLELFEEMDKKFLMEKESKGFYDPNENNKNNKQKSNSEKNDKHTNNAKMCEKDFLNFRKQMLAKEKKLMKQRTIIFDKILNNEFKTNYYIEDGKNQPVNYRLLGRTILMRNLMEQMKYAVFKDETLNVLRGYQSKKISSISSDPNFMKDNQKFANQENGDLIAFAFFNKAKKEFPHFLKLKFNKDTVKKFGEINGSYFGLPV